MSREATRELALLAALGLGAGALFAFTPLDVDVARLFYRPGALNHWPLAMRAPWSLLYAASPWITGSLLLGGIALLAAGTLRQRSAWRRSATFVLLAVVIGPGLFINLLFKDHWDRPRPRDLTVFGGTLPYVAAPLRGPAGTSFPCGHCSVGFLYGLGWWVARRRHPRLAAASLGVGVLAGTALGVARMAAGGHFLSDVIWAALLAYGVAHVLYFRVLRLPLAAEGEPVPLAGPLVSTLALTGAFAALLALFVAPHGERLDEILPAGAAPTAPVAFDLRAPRASVQIDLLPGSGPIRVSGELHGFGLPGSRLDTVARVAGAPRATLHYDIEERGWITDLSARVHIELPVGRLRQLTVQLGEGNVRVVDATRAGVLAHHLVQVQVHTGRGRVRIEASPGAAPAV